ncbi:MAG: sensor histidine kinase [Tissierella sp.]|nr:sensor histidine kinase [Tissierella sp.]
MNRYDSKSLQWTNKNAINFGRILGLLLLCLLWIRDNGSQIGVILLLFLITMTVCRWRFNLPPWTLLIDQIVCLAMIPFWANASFAVAMPIFEAVAIGKIIFSLPVLALILINNQMSFPLVVVFIQAGFIGWVIRSWSLETNKYQKELNQQRRERYEQEELKRELLSANIKVARMSELSERNRIAQELHDSVGHELTGAVLALQAFEKLWHEEDPLAKDMFLKVQERLSNSALILRETVHNIKPINGAGVDRLKEISDGFTDCPLNFKIYGDTSLIPVYLWSILEPCLKEALTNIMRHAKATKVEIELDVNPHLVRLSVYNDGVEDISSTMGMGMGLRNIRQRAKAIGGNISSDMTHGFRLVCVLPILDNH